MPEHMRPNPARALGVGAAWLALWLVPVLALLISVGSNDLFSQIAIFFSKMPLVTFGGPTPFWRTWRSRPSNTTNWVQPRERLDGLGMAETTPGPLVMVVQFVGFMAAFGEASGLSPMLAGTLSSPAREAGHFHALLPLDIRRRAIH